MENQTEVLDWRNEITEQAQETLKIQDGESVPFRFVDEGVVITHADFDPAIRFTVLPLIKNPEMKHFSWYVNKRNFALLNEIKSLGKLTDKDVEVSRTGSKKSDTRY